MCTLERWGAYLRPVILFVARRGAGSSAERDMTTCSFLALQTGLVCGFERAVERPNGLVAEVQSIPVPGFESLQSQNLAGASLQVGVHLVRAVGHLLIPQ